MVEGSWNAKIRHIATAGTHTAAITESGLMNSMNLKYFECFSDTYDLILSKVPCILFCTFSFFFLFFSFSVFVIQLVPRAATIIF